MPRLRASLFLGFGSAILAWGAISIFTFATSQQLPRLVLSSPSPTPTSTVLAAIPARQNATVTKVVDGDTLKVTLNGAEETLRLIGINTPEVTSGVTKEQCFGPEASAFMKSLLPAGTEVQLESDPTQDERDRYDRLLVFAFKDEENVNQTMIEQGYAFEYTFNKPYHYQVQFLAAQTLAHSQQRGLWSPTTCNGKKVIQ